MDLQSLAIQMLVVTMMASLGLELDFATLLGGLRPRRTVATAIALNVVAVPVLGWATVAALPLSSGAAIGVLLCSVAPAGPTGPLFARMARGDVGFAVALVIVLGLVGLVTAPLSMTLLLGRSGETSLLWPMLRTLAAYQVAPLCAAMVVRSVAPGVARRCARPVAVAANVLLLTVITGLLVVRGSLLLSSGSTIHAAAVVLVLFAAAPTLASSDPSGRVRALSMVTAVRNLSVALLLAARCFDDPQADATILLLGFWMMVLPAAFAVVRGRLANGAAEAEQS